MVTRCRGQVQRSDRVRRPTRYGSSAADGSPCSEGGASDLLAAPARRAWATARAPRGARLRASRNSPSSSPSSPLARSTIASFSAPLVGLAGFKLLGTEGTARGLIIRATIRARTVSEYSFISTSVLAPARSSGTSGCRVQAATTLTEGGSAANLQPCPMGASLRNSASLPSLSSAFGPHIVGRGTPTPGRREVFDPRVACATVQLSRSNHNASASLISSDHSR
jgi:hypothetical protein